MEYIQVMHTFNNKGFFLYLQFLNIFSLLWEFMRHILNANLVSIHVYIMWTMTPFM